MLLRDPEKTCPLKISRVLVKLSEILDDFSKDIEKVKNRAEDIKNNRPDQANDFLEKIADMQIKQQKVLDKIEERMPEQVFEKIKETRENVLRHAGEAMLGIEADPEKIAEHISIAFAKQRGSEFKEFKNFDKEKIVMTLHNLLVSILFRNFHRMTILNVGV